MLRQRSPIVPIRSERIGPRSGCGGGSNAAFSRMGSNATRVDHHLAALSYVVPLLSDVIIPRRGAARRSVGCRALLIALPFPGREWTIHS